MKKSKIIALSAVCSALATVCLAFGGIVPILDISLLLLASIAMMLPILAGSYKAGVLSCLASGLLSFLLVPNFAVAVQYAVFFAPYSVLLCFCEDKLSATNRKKLIAIIIKLVFFAIVATGAIKFAGEFINASYKNFAPLIIVIASIAIMFVFDFFMKRIRLQLIAQIKRVLR